jgi:uncharacterized membrane protein
VPEENVSPFDLKSALLAKHAQHVVIIHFPIALYITAVLFDALAVWKKNAILATAAYYNFTVAAIASVPAAATGLLAWQLLFDGKTPRGNLLLHMVLGLTSVLMMWLVWTVQYRARQKPRTNLWEARLGFELAGVLLVALTGHVGGFLSGVNGAG